MAATNPTDLTTTLNKARRRLSETIAEEALMKNGIKVVCALAAAVMLPCGSAHATNPLRAGPLPACGPFDDAFKRFFAELNQAEVWRGQHEGGQGNLRITASRSGAWSMFYYTTDPTTGAERVCTISRGTQSDATKFGQPV